MTPKNISPVKGYYAKFHTSTSNGVSMRIGYAEMRTDIRKLQALFTTTTRLRFHFRKLNPHSDSTVRKQAVRHIVRTPKYAPAQWSNCKIRARGTLSIPFPFPSLPFPFSLPLPSPPSPLGLPSLSLEVGPLFQLGGLGSAVSSPGGAPAEIEFDAF